MTFFVLVWLLSQSSQLPASEHIAVNFSENDGNQSWLVQGRTEGITTMCDSYGGEVGDQRSSTFQFESEAISISRTNHVTSFVHLIENSGVSASSRFVPNRDESTFSASLFTAASPSKSRQG